MLSTELTSKMNRTLPCIAPKKKYTDLLLYRTPLSLNREIFLDKKNLFCEAGQLNNL